MALTLVIRLRILKVAKKEKRKELKPKSIPTIEGIKTDKSSVIFIVKKIVKTVFNH